MNRSLLMAAALTACAPAQTPFGPTDAVAPAAVPVHAAPPPGDLSLNPGFLIAGEPATLTVSGANPNEDVRIVWSLGGFGNGPCPTALGGHCLGVVSPWGLFPPTVSTDAGGDGTLAFASVPANRLGDTACFQAVARRGGGGVDSELTPVGADPRFDVRADNA